MNSFGHNFRITLFGESHGEYLGVVVDGIKPGIKLSESDFAEDIGRRRAYPATVGVTARMEEDSPKIISGIYNGLTTGAPVAILFANSDIRSADYDCFAEHPRPSHADLTAGIKYGGFNDPRGGGIFSGRMTLCLVTAGVIAKKIVPQAAFETCITEIGGCSEPEKYREIIEAAKAAGDSVGGVVQTTVTGLGRGYGEPFFDSVESAISHLLFSVPAVKGVEFGAGFASARSFGRRNNDLIINAGGETYTNNDGGINGGITNGNPIVVRAAIKPAPSIAMPQQTYNFKEERIEELRIGGRHDACITIRAAVVIEAAVAIALADFALRQGWRE